MYTRALQGYEEALGPTCGFTNTGGIDPLNELADVTEDEDLWLHVNGAYRAPVLLSQKHKQLAAGIVRAHSLSWDAHKWLFQTCACGLLLVRDKHTLVQSFTINTSYIQDTNEASAEEVNFWNRGMELTRLTRAMKLWFTLRLLGTDKIAAMIDHGIGLTETAENSLQQRPNWQSVISARHAQPKSVHSYGHRNCLPPVCGGMTSPCPPVHSYRAA